MRSRFSASRRALCSSPPGMFALTRQRPDRLHEALDLHRRVAQRRAVVDDDVAQLVELLPGRVAALDLLRVLQRGDGDDGDADLARGQRHVDGHGVAARGRGDDEDVALSHRIAAQQRRPQALDALELRGERHRSHRQVHAVREDRVDQHQPAGAVDHLLGEHERVAGAEREDGLPGDDGPGQGVRGLFDGRELRVQPLDARRGRFEIRLCRHGITSCAQYPCSLYSRSACALYSRPPGRLTLI